MQFNVGRYVGAYVAIHDPLNIKGSNSTKQQHRVIQQAICGDLDSLLRTTDSGPQINQSMSCAEKLLITTCVLSETDSSS